MKNTSSKNALLSFSALSILSAFASPPTTPGVPGQTATQLCGNTNYSYTCVATCSASGSGGNNNSNPCQWTRSSGSEIWDGYGVYEHIAVDYDSTGSGSSSCGTCAGAPAKFDLPSLKIARRFASRPEWYFLAEYGFAHFMSNQYGTRILTLGNNRFLVLGS